MHPVEPTKIVSSGLGSDATKSRKAMAKLQPAHRGCSSKSSLNVPRSVTFLGFPKGPFLTISLYSSGINSSKLGLIFIILRDIFHFLLRWIFDLNANECPFLHYLDYNFRRHCHSAIYPRTWHYTIIIRYYRGNFPTKPAGPVKFRDYNLFSLRKG